MNNVSLSLLTLGTFCICSILLSELPLISCNKLLLYSQLEKGRDRSLMLIKATALCSRRRVQLFERESWREAENMRQLRRYFASLDAVKTRRRSRASKVGKRALSFVLLELCSRRVVGATWLAADISLW